MLLEEGLYVEVDVHLYDVLGQGDQHQAAWVGSWIRHWVVVARKLAATLLFLLLVIPADAAPTNVIELTLLRYLDLLDPREKVQPCLHGCVVEFVQLRLQDGETDAVQNRLTMEKVEVPYPQDELKTFQSLNVYKHGHHPTMQEELIFEVDTLELGVQLGQHPRKQFVEKVHSPLYLS